MNNDRNILISDIFCGWQRMFAALYIAVYVSFVPFSANAFDVKSAETTFKKCSICHDLGEGASKKIGPPLIGLTNRPIASVEGYKYSKAFKKAASEGFVWNRETLDQFLKRPKAYIIGTRMSFAGLKKDKERSNLVEWLLHFNFEGKEYSNKINFKSASKELLGSKAAVLKGDPEYGQYLSGECVTCHRVSGEDKGIPSIIGWPKEIFIDALYQYKMEKRKNPVMRTIAKRLGEEEIAALAAYFGSLRKE